MPNLLLIAFYYHVAEVNEVPMIYIVVRNGFYYIPYSLMSASLPGLADGSNSFP